MHTTTTSLSETITYTISTPPSQPEVESKKPKPSSKYKGVVPQPTGRWGAQIYDKHQRVWLGTFACEDEAAEAYDVAALRFRGPDAILNFSNSHINRSNGQPFDRSNLNDRRAAALIQMSFLSSHSKAEVVDMLRKHMYHDELSAAACGPPRKKVGPTCFSSVGRVLLFEKVVTPSDVGKLNRLVVPKQQAEKHFPLVRNGNDYNNNSDCKGILINFEDGSGKVWRLRYSYWNSSQSYVLTKGWNRFVKEKGLKAGDKVSFYRSNGTEVSQLYIDSDRSCTGEDSSRARARVVKLFGVDISENGKRGREIEGFQQTIGLKKPLVVAL